MRLIAMLAMLIPLPAWAAPDVVLSGAIDRVVAAGGHVAAIRNGEVRVLTEDGRPLFRLGDEIEDRQEGRRSTRADEILDLFDVPEGERDGDLAETLVDDELTLRERRGRPAVAEPEAPPQLAASGDHVWIAARGGLWRVGSGGEPRRAAASLPRVDRVAAGAGRLLVAEGTRLWQSSDEGATFAIVRRADRPLRAIAAAAHGTAVAFATDERLWWTNDEGESASAVIPATPSDLLFCGSTLLLLHRYGVRAIEGDGAVTDVPLDAPARRLACAPDGRWTIAGPGLLVGEAGHLRARGDLPPHAVLDAAWGERCLWVGTRAGLLCLSPQESAPAVAAGVEAPVPAMTAHWASLLPNLVLGGSLVRRGQRDDVRAFAVADFPLGQRTLPRGARRLAHTHISLLAHGEPTAPSSVDPDAGCLPPARAAAVARALAEPDRARSFVERARRAAWLPELRVRVDRRLGRNESLDVPAGAVDAVGPLGLDTANDVRYEARATWDLSRLVFSSEEIAAAAQALRMADMRREIESLANRLYFERRRLKMEPLETPDAPVRLRRDLRVQEVEADLDALSGGVFGRCLSSGSQP